MKRLSYALSVLMIPYFFVGCVGFGRGKDFKPFDENSINQITAGVTRADDVTRLFGPPNKIFKLSNGNAYLYERSINKVTVLWLIILSLGNFDTQYDRIVFFLNNDDVVTHFGISFNAESAAYAMPF